ncbi:MAG TPA: polymer-forming cytoskeletal protein [Candidatus Dormibacteraeota bacterium]|nr:polymer-forming cytoskeletal protein [Candidatus Dormibacteraeota bacterium]
METQEAVAESAPMENHNQSDAKRDGQKKFTLGPNDSLEGKLTYDGHMTVDGGRAEGEFRIGGNIEIGNGTVVKALLEGSNVTIKGEVEGRTTARDKLTLGKSAKLSGDVQVRRLQIEDGATLNGYVRMGDFEHQAGS